MRFRGTLAIPRAAVEPLAQTGRASPSCDPHQAGFEPVTLQRPFLRATLAPSSLFTEDFIQTAAIKHIVLGYKKARTQTAITAHQIRHAKFPNFTLLGNESNRYEYRLHSIHMTISLVILNEK